MQVKRVQREQDMENDMRYASGFLAAALSVSMLNAVSAPVAESAKLPPDSEYCVVDADGHLSIGGSRVRFWGAIGSFPGRRETVDGDPYAMQRAAVARASRMGFNMFRIWHLSFDDDYELGDLSRTDVSDFFVAECAKNGIRLWAAGFGGGSLYEDEVESAAMIAGSLADEQEWIDSVNAMLGVHWWSNKRKALSLLTPAVVWDERLEKLAIESMRRKANHFNKYRGMRHGDDPVFAVWELTNEQWWIRNMVSGKWKQMPVFFRRSLLEEWHAFLKEKYEDDKGLEKAWGFLVENESLAAGSVILAPLAGAYKAVELNDTNPAALAAFETVESAFGREDFTAQRGADVLEFLTKLLVDHKKRFAAELKTWGKSCRLSPVIFDTGIGESIQAQYLHQQADAVAHASYMEGLQSGKIDKKHKRWPFYSGLDKPPQMANDVPWLEHNRTPGKPFLCYETQYGSPSKYRAEWPVRIASLASVQDWDAVCFHYWTFNRYDMNSDRPYSGLALSYPGSGAYQYDYTSDEVEFSQMRTAGPMFRFGLLDAAPHPTVFTFGKKALYDPDSMDYAGSYGSRVLDMLSTAYRYGSRLVIDPEQEDFLNIDGSVIRYNGYETPCPARPTDQLEFDYQKGHILIDAPGVVSYVGFFGQYGSDEIVFTNGVRLSGISYSVPEGCPYPPEEDEKFICFSLVSGDGKPLEDCSKAVLSLVSSSFNTGFRVDSDTGKVSYGDVPVLVTRVGAKVYVPHLAGAEWRMIDFDGKDLDENESNQLARCVHAGYDVFGRCNQQ